MFPRYKMLYTSTVCVIMLQWEHWEVPGPSVRFSLSFVQLFGCDMQDPHNFAYLNFVSFLRIKKKSDALQLLLDGFTSDKPV
jgi:hypothetical protein